MVSDLISPHDPHSDDLSSFNTLQALVTRMQLWPQLIRRQQEEEIIRLVSIESEFLEAERSSYLDGRDLEVLLDQFSWTIEDLDLHVARPESLRRFAKQLFGPGLEELFLSANGNHDQIIYSILRVRDAGLAQELWIRIAEGEASFAELAAQYGEGPEAARKGIMGPLPMGNIGPPELALLLRTLKVGDVNCPTVLGDWHVLLRLEKLSPARFDAKMQGFLLDQQMSAYLDDRVNRILSGEAIDLPNFDS